MKKTCRILSLVLALVMMATTLTITMTATVSAAPTGSAVAFVKDGATGTGASFEDATGSLSTAVSKVAKAGGGTVVVCGLVTIKSNVYIGTGSNDVTVKITSVYDGVDYRLEAGAALFFGAYYKNFIAKNPFEFDDLDIYVAFQKCSFYGNGYPLTFGKGVAVVLDPSLKATVANNYPNIYGGSANDLSAATNFPANTSVTVLAGKWNKILAGGKGSEEKPRPSLDGSVSIAENVVVMDESCKGGFSANAATAFSGKRTAIYNGNPNSSSLAPEDTEITVYASGNGYVQGISAGVVNLWAESGYGAKIGDEIYHNGRYEFSGSSLTVQFVESDINRTAELDAARPRVPSGFPGEYIKGYDNGDGSFSFRPAGNITIAESATILVRLLTTEEKIKGKYKTDKANADDWFYDNIAYLDTFGYFDAFENFDGNRAITRAEFVNMIILAASSLTESGEEISFTDVPETHKYYDDIKKATMAKLVNGYDNDDGTFAFCPDASITRAEVVTVINRVFNMADLAPIKYKKYIPDFSDVDETHWAAFQIIAAAGGKEKPAEKIDFSGSGEVEHVVSGDVIFVSDAGSAENDGKTPETSIPFKTAINDSGMLSGGGTVVVCGPVTITSNVRLSNNNTKPVLITNVYDGVDYRQTNNAAIIFGAYYKNLIACGDVILDNLAFVTNFSSCSIYADNHRLEIGKDVVCVIAEGGTPIAVYAGSANDLGACTNYIGSQSTAISHTGDYYGNLTVNSGTWGIVTGKGKGSAAKPRHSEATVVTLSGNTIISDLTAGTKATDEVDGVEGLRVIILNNYTPAELDGTSYDALVRVNGAASAQAVSIARDKVIVKVTADDGRAIPGLADDGTYTIEGEGVLLVDVDDTSASASFVGKGEAGTIEDVNAEIVTDEFLAEIDAKADALKAEILATKTEVVPAAGKTAYYVSVDGDDENDGKNPESAWKTIDKLNTATFAQGDVVYLRRGDEWRGTQLKAKAGVTYSAYGEGAKPVINMSPFDGAKHGTWTLTDTPNVYVYSEKFVYDIGSIAFNERTFTDIYAQKVMFDYNSGELYDKAGLAVENPLTYLTGDLYFWHDLKGANINYASGGELYLRSDSGNPAERFSNIEFNQRQTAVNTGGDNITIDNITVRHSGAHGVSANTVNNLLVQNCVFEWIGGSIHKYTSGKATRFGNAVEVYGGCDNYVVNHCYIDQVYDAGVTHQISDDASGDFIMKNVTYSNNLILNCVYSIEHFNRAAEGTTRYLTGITYKDNICRFAGYGFGITRGGKSDPAHIRSGYLVETADFVIENNIFDRSTSKLFALQTGGDEEIQWKNNTYIHTLGGTYGSIKSMSKPYTSNIVNEISFGFNHPEIGGRYLFVKK